MGTKCYSKEIFFFFEMWLFYFYTILLNEVFLRSCCGMTCVKNLAKSSKLSILCTNLRPWAGGCHHFLVFQPWPLGWRLQLPLALWRVLPGPHPSLTQQDSVQCGVLLSSGSSGSALSTERRKRIDTSEQGSTFKMTAFQKAKFT